jgi:hypothetical protein
VIDSALIERFDSEESSNLLARKALVLELSNIRHGWVKLSYFHDSPPVSLIRLMRADTLLFSLALRLCTSSIAGEREEKCGEIHKTFFFSRHRSSSYAHPVTQMRYPDK